MSGPSSFFEQIFMLILYALIPLAGGAAAGAIIGLFVGWLREAYLWWVCWGAGIGVLAGAGFAWLIISRATIQ